MGKTRSGPANPDRVVDVTRSISWVNVSTLSLSLPQQALQPARVAIRGTPAGLAVTLPGRANRQGFSNNRGPPTYPLLPIVQRLLVF